MNIDESFNHPYDMSISLDQSDSAGVDRATYFDGGGDGGYDCFGTFGTAGSAGGCIGTIGSWGCCC